MQYGPFHLGHLAEGAVEEVPAKLWRAPDGTGWLQLVGAGNAGVELELVMPDSKPFSFKLLDRSYGLAAAGAP